MKLRTLFLLPPILFLSSFLSAQACVTFDSLPAGSSFGSSAGQVAGEFIFTEHKIIIAVDSFRLSASTSAFQSCQLIPGDPSFSMSPHLSLNNISLAFDFSSLGQAVYELKLDYRSQGGFDNIQVNDGEWYILPISAIPFRPAPGVMAFPATGANSESLTLVGQISRLRIGGQELLLDNVCVRNTYSDYPLACERFEELEIGQTFALGAWVIMPEEPEGFQAFIFADSFPGAAPGDTNRLITLVDNHPAFSSGRHLQLDNIGIYIQPLLPLWPGYHLPRLTFKYLSLGEPEHFSVNGWPPYEGRLAEIPWDYFPGIIISQYFDPQGNYMTVEGELFEIRLSGQRLLVDDICMSPITDVEESVLPERPSVSVFPNPASLQAILFIRVENYKARSATFEFFDAQGRRLGPVHTLEGELTEISIKGMPSGLYFFRLVKDGLVLSAGKVVLQ